MKTFKEYLEENYKNFIGPQSKADKEKWSRRVWDILVKSYAPIGGIKGSGFSSRQDMIDNIPFWKIYVKNGKVLAAALYKDKNGRKLVAIATDGSDFGKKIVTDIFKANLGVSYGEKSGPALALMVKTVPWEQLQNFLLTPEQVKKLTGDDIFSVKSYGVDKLDKVDRMTYDKFPQLSPYFYVRDLGGEKHLKVSMGTPNLPIIRG